MTINIALIIGCARSGTSILGELISSHPSVRYISEAHRVWQWGGSGRNESHRLTLQHATPDVKRRIRRWFERRKGSGEILVEKNPRNVLRVPYIREIFPEAKIIHIVRDGRDVACSLVPGCGGRVWFHLKPPSWKHLRSCYVGPLRCALVWKEFMELALEDLSHVSHLQVRYEDLVRRPQLVGENVLSYLGLSMQPETMEFCNRIVDETEGSYHARRQRVWYRDNHKFRIGRWRENLTGEEQRVISGTLSRLLRRLGYG